MLLVMTWATLTPRSACTRASGSSAHWRLTTARDRTVDETGLRPQPFSARRHRSRVSTPSPSPGRPSAQLHAPAHGGGYFHRTPLFIDHTTDTGMPILYEPASDVGADRIVDAVAALTKYGTPCVVVDFGTATTCNAVSARGEYLGGVITPGIQISSDALFARAARLPRVEIKARARHRSSTVGSLQSGLYYGYIGLVDGILRASVVRARRRGPRRPPPAGSPRSSRTARAHRQR